MIYTLFLLSLARNVFGDDVIISTTNDFINFARSVDAGNNYSGTTVYLNSDLSLSGAMNPIGTNPRNYFRGTFDGKGNILSNFVIKSSLHAYTGLFGYSTGLTVRNVVLGPSCSITNSFNSSSNIYVGGVIGKCGAENEQCNIENSVNMADVTFDGNISDRYLFIGGFIGQLYSSSYVKNCANYGSVTYLGVRNYTRIGGIVGDFASQSSHYRNIYNCVNFGTITHNGITTNDLFVGGITGYSKYAYIENCVSAGKIDTQNAPSESYIGGLVGYIKINIHINYCYYTNNVGVNELYGFVYSKPNSTTGTSNSPTTVDSDLVSKLNINATSCNWNKWLLNANNATVTYKTNDNSGLSLSSQLVLIPNPVSIGSHTFDGWYTDPYYIIPSQPDKVTEETTFYGLYGSIIAVTFNTSGGEESVPASKPVAYDEKYGSLPIPKRTGYMFLGWFTNETNGTEVTSETIVNISDNHTLYAHWEEVTNQVEVVFNKKDLTREEVENIIRHYTNADFTIEKFENESGEIRAIIKFDGKEEAEEFVESINEHGGSDDFKKAKFVFGDRSFSTTVCPHSFLNTLFL